MKKLNDSGSHVIGVIIIVFVVVAIGFIGLKVMDKSKSKERAGGSSVLLGCKGNGPVTFSHAPMDMKDVDKVLPIGTLAGAHVTPIDHLYFYPKDMKNRDAAPVYAMADGFIVSYQERTQNVDKGTAQKGEYRLEIQHNCDVVSYFDLITSLDPILSQQIKDKSGKDLRIPVKAGQVIGRVGAQSLDTAVYNYSMKLKGFVKPDSYKAESWKIHTDDFFKYFDDPIKSEILAKNPRTTEPRGGKIDYDIEGKLVGNWFLEGTNGYAGAGKPEDNQVARSDGSGYWSGHFSIAPDAIDVAKTNISFGSYQGQAKQFTAVDDSLDPSSVDISNGIVAYEFIQFSNPGMMMDQQMQGTPRIEGTVLFQVLDGNKMKMEAFPGKTKDQAKVFTSDAKTYER